MHDTGLACLVMLARFHNIAASPEQLAHEFSEAGQPFGREALQLAAKTLGFKTKLTRSTAGNDTLRGNLGKDYLLGGDGSDTYQFAAGHGQDIINNLSNTPTADTDVPSIEGITRQNLWLSRQGDSLVIDVVGSKDSITIQDWYASTAQQLDSIQAGGSTLYASAVDNLVNAMAAFGAPAGGEIQLTPAQRDQLNVVIAANWQ